MTFAFALSVDRKRETSTERCSFNSMEASPVTLKMLDLSEIISDIS